MARQIETEQQAQTSADTASPTTTEAPRDPTRFGGGPIPQVSVSVSGPELGATAREYERHQQLHDPSWQYQQAAPRRLPPLPPTPAGQASVLTADDRQAMHESLAGQALQHPFAGELQQMGLTESEMPVAVGSIRNYDQIDRTTALPQARLADELPALAAATEATRAAMRGEVPAGSNEPYQTETLGQSLQLLALRLHLFISDQPDTSINNKAAVTSGITALVEGRTTWLRRSAAEARGTDDRGGHARLRLGEYTSSVSNTSELAMLRELSVFDPGLARSLGTAYVDALRSAIELVGATPLSVQV
ncbi:MAG TPA: hypothetical protein VFQ53_38905 [Kofleriaceae bacterium]|nr:hypothetical protein [Kofleriaceae bacterium]